FPLLVFGVCNLFRLSPTTSLGLMIVSFCPSGQAANLYSFIYKGNTAFSVSSSAITCVISPLTISYFTALAGMYFFGEAKTVAFPAFRDALELMASTVGPIVLGMLVRRLNPALALLTKTTVRIVSGLVLFITVVGVLAKFREYIIPGFKEAGIPAAI